MSACRSSVQIILNIVPSSNEMYEWMWINVALIYSEFMHTQTLGKLFRCYPSTRKWYWKLRQRRRGLKECDLTPQSTSTRYRLLLLCTNSRVVPCEGSSEIQLNDKESLQFVSCCYFNVVVLIKKFWNIFFVQTYFYFIIQCVY